MHSWAGWSRRHPERRRRPLRPRSRPSAGSRSARCSTASSSSSPASPRSGSPSCCSPSRSRSAGGASSGSSSSGRCSPTSCCRACTASSPTIYVPDYFIGRARTSDGLLGDPVNLAVLGDERAAARGDGRGGVDARRRDHAALQLAHHHVDRHPAQLRRGAREPAVPVRPAAGCRVPAGGRRAIPRSGTTCASGAAPTAGCCRAAPAWTGSRPARSTARWASRCSRCRSRTRSTPTPTSSATTSWPRCARRTRPSPSRCIEDFATGYHSRNGGGDTIVTDGDLPVIDVRAMPAADAASPREPVA